MFGKALLHKIVLRAATLETYSLQTLCLGNQYFTNLYALSGIENRRDRAQLFTRDIFPLLLQHQTECLPVLVGDWNCLVTARDTTASFREKYSKDLNNQLKTFKYSDAYRIIHPNTEEFPFHRASCSPSCWIEYICHPTLHLTCLQSPTSRGWHTT